MSIVNGVWHNALMDPPGVGYVNDAVLSVREIGQGSRAYRKIDISIYSAAENKPGSWNKRGVILWMPLPKIPEIGEVLEQEREKDQLKSDFHDCVNELCLHCGAYHREHEGACDGCRWLKPRRGW